jgi:hypothetical protein
LLSEHNAGSEEWHQIVTFLISQTKHAPLSQGAYQIYRFSVSDLDNAYEHKTATDGKEDGEVTTKMRRKGNKSPIRALEIRLQQMMQMPISLKMY